MQELKLGAIKQKDLAEWFGIKPNSFSHVKDQKMEELKFFANYHIEDKKIIIDEIFEPVYTKQGSENYRKVINKIDEVWDDSGLDTCSRVGKKVYYSLIEEDKDFKIAPSTIENYTRKGRNELYGVPFMDGGKIGSCVYMWCKRDKETGNYSLLTEEEQVIKENLQKKYFGDATEKQIIVKAMIEEGEITREQGWDVLEQLTNMNGNNFMAFLTELQNKLHCQVIRGTLVERNEQRMIEESAF